MYFVTTSSCLLSHLAWQVQRTYQALTIGVPKEGSGTVETNILRDPKDRLKMCISGFYSNRYLPLFDAPTGESSYI